MEKEVDIKAYIVSVMTMKKKKKNQYGTRKRRVNSPGNKNK